MKLESKITINAIILWISWSISTTRSSSKMGMLSISKKLIFVYLLYRVGKAIFFKLLLCAFHYSRVYACFKNNITLLQFAHLSLPHLSGRWRSIITYRPASYLFCVWLHHDHNRITAYLRQLKRDWTFKLCSLFLSMLLLQI